MKGFACGAALLVAAGALVGAGVAAAAPTGGSSAANVVRELEDAGYSVQLNGTQTGPLSGCIVTDVHGSTDTDSAGRLIRPTSFTTVYVDIICPSSDN